MPLRGLILAGGASSRMGQPKALIEVEGETFLERLVRLFEPHCEGVWAVVGCHAEAIGGRAPCPLIEAQDWALGMRASLRAGLQALPPGDVLLTHVDRPDPAPATLAALAAAPDLVVAAHQGRTGHPVRLPASLRARLCEADDTPLRELIEPRPIELNDPGIHLNLNTPEAVERYRRARQRR